VVFGVFEVFEFFGVFEVFEVFDVFEIFVVFDVFKFFDVFGAVTSLVSHPLMFRSLESGRSG
jgi:hypothetical protein